MCFLVRLDKSALGYIKSGAKLLLFYQIRVYILKKNVEKLTHMSKNLA